jgi:redox-sensitive bicupin YhaK (pirin superfamily)
MAKTILHRADTRGRSLTEWLESYHTFSFADYYDPKRIHFGALRVLNDDRVAPGMGFGAHAHDNFEIISIPLSGDLEHKDNMGNTSVIRSGDIQVMSAGTGIRHSEYNKNRDKEVRFLQIWVIPNQENVTPRYDQITVDSADRHNKLQQILSPDPHDEGVWIHQDAWFFLGKFDQGMTIDYSLHLKENGVYIFVLEGKFTLDEINLSRRDGLGVWDTDQIRIKSDAPDAELLLMEVPMLI